MSATNERDHAARMAGRDDASALRIARNIGDPWYRCQALAYVALHTADVKRFLGLVAESLESGWSIEDANRSVTVVAWPVAVLARRNDPGPDARKRNDRVLREAVNRVVKTIIGEPNPASRADALLCHIHALSPSRRELRDRVLGLLVKDCRDVANRKRQRQLEHAALVIAPDDLNAALGLAALLNENRRRRTIESIEARCPWLGPWLFSRMSDPPP